MHRNRQISIILADTLLSVGLQTLLTDYFPPVEIYAYTDFDALNLANNDATDYYFTSSEIFVFNQDFFLPRRNKTVIVTNHLPGHEVNPLAPYYISTHISQENMIGQLRLIFSGEPENSYMPEGGKELSNRETDVLQLIVKGITNKEIADKLNISLNTVLSHRKNITSKLGIKTISGLTFYSIMHGIISGDEIGL